MKARAGTGTSHDALAFYHYSQVLAYVWLNAKETEIIAGLQTYVALEVLFKHNRFSYQKVLAMAAASRPRPHSHPSDNGGSFSLDVFRGLKNWSSQYLSS